MFHLQVTFKFKWWVPKNESKALKMASEGKDTEGGRARFDRILQIVSGGVVPKQMNGGLCPLSSCRVGSDKVTAGSLSCLVMAAATVSTHCCCVVPDIRGRKSHDRLLWREEHVTSVFVLAAMVQES